MKYKALFFSFLLVLSTGSFAEDQPQEPVNSNGTEKLTKYLKNFASYLGYDVENPPDPVPETVLFKFEETNKNSKELISSYLRSILGLTDPKLLGTSDAGLNFPEKDISQTFTDFAEPGKGKISASPLMDQFMQSANGESVQQTDPVSQAVLNILSTPTFKGCFDSAKDDAAIGTECLAVLYREKLMKLVTGVIPSPDMVYSMANNQKWLPELNSNSLLSPLMYSESKEQAQPDNGKNGGLIANNSYEKAGNFVRYASGLVVPPALPSKEDYRKLYNNMLAGGNVTEKGINASGALGEYLNKLKVYSAQVSVGLSNLYYIVSKRMPQTIDDKQTSQAMNEFKMATWRLNTPSKTSGQENDNSWIKQINTASPAAVQKEVAILLAEMNYQLYLNRQQQERLLLTESILLFQGAKNMQPSPVLGSPEPQNAPLQNLKPAQ